MVVALLVVGTLIYLTISLHRSGAGQLDRMRAVMAAIPLPAHSRLVDEQALSPSGDVDAYLQRTYVLPSATDSTAALYAVLAPAGYTFGKLRGESGLAAWRELTSPTSGDVYVSPPGRHTTLDFNWHGSQLVIRLSGSDL